jgi:hypothetical protein
VNLSTEGKKHFLVTELCNGRFFSAEGSNVVFEIINNYLASLESTEALEIEIDFSGISLVSTSFVGRFQEHIKSTRAKYNLRKIRLLSLQPLIKRQFLMSD